MIYFDPVGAPTIRANAADPFRPRLLAILRAVERGAPFRWTEVAHDAVPTTTAHRRMLERLLLSYSAGAHAPGWLSPGVRAAILHNALMRRNITPGPGAAALLQARGLGPGAGARRLDDLQGPGTTTGEPGLTPLNRAGGPGAGGPGAGAHRAGRVIVVGDRPGPGWGDRAPSWPFISANRSGCSAWLAEQLERAQIGEEQLYWVNAYAKDGTPLAHGAVEALPLWLTTSTLIVALGRNAARWCESGKWGCAEVHHPQYWKRFHSKEPYHLLKLLRRHLCG